MFLEYAIVDAIVDVVDVLDVYGSDFSIKVLAISDNSNFSIFFLLFSGRGEGGPAKKFHLVLP